MRLVTVYLHTSAGANELAEMYDISLEDADAFRHLEVSVTMDMLTGDIVGADGRKLSNESVE